jgi:hypothetical protein
MEWFFVLGNTGKPQPEHVGFHCQLIIFMQVVFYINVFHRSNLCQCQWWMVRIYWIAGTSHVRFFQVSLEVRYIRCPPHLRLSSRRSAAFWRRYSVFSLSCALIPRHFSFCIDSDDHRWAPFENGCQSWSTLPSASYKKLWTGMPLRLIEDAKLNWQANLPSFVPFVMSSQ